MSPSTLDVMVHISTEDIFALPRVFFNEDLMIPIRRS